MYAIVRSGGKQHRVAVGDVISVDRLGAGTGETVVLPALLHVDGETVTTDAEALAGIRVDAEVMSNTKGPKIDILRYKNKSGYRRRQGHRAKLTTLRVTAINTGEHTDVEHADVEHTAVEHTAVEQITGE